MKRQVIPEIGEVTQKRVHFEEVGMLVRSYKARHNPPSLPRNTKGYMPFQRPRKHPIVNRANAARIAPSTLVNRIEFDPVSPESTVKRVSVTENISIIIYE